VAHRALATQEKLAYLGFQCLVHPPYSPDLALSGYRLFPWTEKTIEREVGRAEDLSAPRVISVSNVAVFLSDLPLSRCCKTHKFLSKLK
jgi:hypothetical protein